MRSHRRCFLSLSWLWSSFSVTRRRRPFPIPSRNFAPRCKKNGGIGVGVGVGVGEGWTGGRRESSNGECRRANVEIRGNSGVFILLSQDRRSTLANVLVQ